jgi:hypothetical protein
VRCVVSKEREREAQIVKSTLASWLAFLVFVRVLVPQASAAAPVPNLAGTFRLVAEQSDRIDEAIGRAIAPMSFFARPFARRRLQKINTPYERLMIGATADNVVVVADPRIPVQTPLTGAPIKWKREDGEPFDVTGVWDGTVFQQTFASGTGRRVNRYSVSADGQTLTLQVVVRGGGLPGAMTYQLVYRRVS